MEGRWLAAVLACRRHAPSNGAEGRPSGNQAPETTAVLDRWGAALSHRSAAVLWRLLPQGEAAICVSVTGIGGKEMHKGIHLHRSRTLTAEQVTSHRGIPVTTPARTVADLRRAPTTRGCPGAIPAWELRRAIRQAEVLDFDLEGAEHLTERTRSDLELAFLRLCRRHGLAEPEANAWIGSLQVDFLWRAQRLVVETDSYRYHRGPAAFAKDRKRDLELRVLGYDVIRLSEQQVTERPAHALEVLSDSIASRSRIPSGVAMRPSG